MATATLRVIAPFENVLHGAQTAPENVSHAIQNRPHLTGLGSRFERPTDDAPQECDVANVEFIDGDTVGDLLPMILTATDAAFWDEENGAWDVRVALAEGGASW